MKAKETVTNVTLRQRFEQAGLACDVMVATIGGYTKSTNEKTGDVYTLVLSVINRDNKIEQFVGKVFAGINNKEHIENTAKFFESFVPGDYVLQNVELRVKGETWEDSEGKKGVYENSYISIPFISSLLVLGKDAIMISKENEIKLAKMALQAIDLKEE